MFRVININSGEVTGGDDEHAVQKYFKIGIYENTCVKRGKAGTRRVLIRM